VNEKSGVGSGVSDQSEGHVGDTGGHVGNSEQSGKMDFAGGRGGVPGGGWLVKAGAAAAAAAVVGYALLRR
jgi:hypothetical protein